MDKKQNAYSQSQSLLGKLTFYYKRLLMILISFIFEGKSPATASSGVPMMTGAGETAPNPSLLPIPFGLQ